MEKTLDIKLGFSCNNNCRFCHLTDDEKKLGDRGTEEIKRDLFFYINKKGVYTVALGGGEPTIRSDIIDLIRHASYLGYRRIIIMTNGRMFYYMDFCTRVVDSGANRFVFSLAGHTPGIHDYLVMAKGAFNQAISGIHNLKELNQEIIVNSVITKQNYKFLPRFVNFLMDIGIDQIQLAFPKSTGNAYTNFDEIIPLKSEVMPHLHEALDMASEAGTPIIIESYPFCLLSGYEQYHYLMYVQSTKFRNVDGKISKAYGPGITGPPCRKCRYEPICKGARENYIKKFGWGEFKPVPGKKIKTIPDLNEILQIRT